jgi:hypothetical protein
MKHHSLLILTWDEDDGSQSNHIAMIFAGQLVRPRRCAEPITHYSVLATIGAAARGECTSALEHPEKDSTNARRQIRFQAMNRAIAMYWQAAAAQTYAWKTSWKPNTDGDGSGRRRW